MKTVYSLFIALLVPVCFLLAQPNLATKQAVGDIMVYQDFYKKDLFYYAPYGLELVRFENGKPDFKFLQIRYTGTRATSDQGEKRFKSLIHFKVSQYIPNKEELRTLKETLKQKKYYVNELQPIPISNLNAHLIYAATNENDSINNKISGGFFENTTESPLGINWKERDFTIRLNEHDSELFWNNLHGDQPTLSVNYSFSSKFMNSVTDEVKLTGNGELRETLEESLTQIDSTKTDSLSEHIFMSASLNIQVDTNKWPDLLKRVDINESTIPPDYAAIDIYCFDFNNEIVKDMYSKRVEIKAKGVSGSDIILKRSFNVNEPEVYAQTIRFSHAIKLSQPYEYRITKIFTDGSYERSKWIVNENWHERLDITQKPNNQ